MTREDYILFGAKVTAKRGNDLPHAKLTPDAVVAIRENRYGKTRKQLAAEYQVHHRTIEKIHYRQCWTHI